MLLIDTGPIVALVDKKDNLHRRAVEVSNTIDDQLYTTQACITESLYLLYDAGGWPAQRILRRMIEADDIRVLASDPNFIPRTFTYMERFQDIPCDYADATLLDAAEYTGARSIFTFDRHFHAYRLSDGAYMNVIP